MARQNEGRALAAVDVDAPRFWAKVERGSDGCWLWTGATNAKGYGYFGVRDGDGWRVVKAHRAAFALDRGVCPEGALVCHRCDTPACVNPAHLFEGDASTNMRDMWSKGRHPRLTGSLNPSTRLTVEQVATIREARAGARGDSAGYLGSLA